MCFKFIDMSVSKLKSIGYAVIKKIKIKKNGLLENEPPKNKINSFFFACTINLRIHFFFSIKTSSEIWIKMGLLQKKFTTKFLLSDKSNLNLTKIRTERRLDFFFFILNGRDWSDVR